MAAKMRGHSRGCWAALWLVALAVPAQTGSIPPLPTACKEGEAACQAHVHGITEKLEAMRVEMAGKQATLSALEDLRTGILTGKRIELPSAQRQHLERGSPLISEISFDARHRPVSTNVSRHFTSVRTLAQGKEVILHTFMPLKKSSSSAKAGPSTLFVTIDKDMKLSINSLEGDILLDSADLGHEAKITQMTLSPSQDNHFIVTADEAGTVRVHNLKVVAKKAEKEHKDENDLEHSDDDDQEKEKPMKKKKGRGDAGGKKNLTVTANFSCTFSLPAGKETEARTLNTVLPIDRGSQTYFVTGDSLGGISVFFRNGTMKGRVRVTEDDGGVRGLLRSQGQMILFWSSHSFGFFSVTQIDVQYQPCSGWNSPLFDVALDPSYSSSRVVLALADGDVLVYSTAKGKSKACDLTLKFPHVSALPFKLHGFRGHIMALPTPLDNTERKADYLREIFFFNLAAMDAGYGTGPSKTVALQVSFKPRQPDVLALFASPGGSGDRSKSQVALRFADERGVELYELSLKQPPAPKAVSGEEGGEASSGWGGNWLNWFPKIGVFGIALIGVVIWNVRKVTNQRGSGGSGGGGGGVGGGADSFDDEYFKERLAERRMERDSKEKSEDGGAGVGVGDSNAADDE